MDQRRWKKLSEKLLIPRLPGEWFANSKGMLVRLPIERVARIIAYERSSYSGTEWRLWACVQPLYLEDDILDYMQGLKNRTSLETSSSDEITVDEFWALVGSFIEEVLSFHEQHGSVAGYLELCKKSISRDIHDAFWGSWRGKAFSELYLGDYALAAESFVHTREMLQLQVRKFELDQDDGRTMGAVEAERYIQWIHEDPEAARASLKDIERSQRAFYKLPPMEEAVR